MVRLAAYDLFEAISLPGPLVSVRRFGFRGWPAQYPQRRKISGFVELHRMPRGLREIGFCLYMLK